jgi:hypothetical protein
LVRQFASENSGSAKTERGRGSKKIKQEIMERRGLGGRSGHASKKRKGNKGEPEIITIDSSDEERGSEDGW